MKPTGEYTSPVKARRIGMEEKDLEEKTASGVPGTAGTLHLHADH